MIAQHSSASWEHFTPREVVAAARKTLGGIDLDPASCAKANKRIKAKQFFSVEDDGLTQPWRGRVFVNPPGGAIVLRNGEKASLQNKANGDRLVENRAAFYARQVDRWSTKSRSCAWWRKLVEEFDAGRVRSAIFVGFTLEILRSAQLGNEGRWAEPFDFTRCYPRNRLQFEGADPTHANVIVYLGGHDRRFRAFFEPFGRVVR